MTDNRASATRSILLDAASRLRSRIRAVLEENERERLSLPHGWHDHVRMVYAQYFDQRRGKAKETDARRQQWRKKKDGAGD